MDGREIMAGLISRGYPPVQAAAIAGHVLQESGGNPSAINPKEGAQGLLQWRLDRLDNLRNFAKARGTDPSDPNLQLDFIRREMEGPEAKSSAAFRGAADLPSASAALKPYIRFGDNSDEVRLNNARGLLGQAPAAPTARIAQAAIPAAAADAGVPSVSDAEKTPSLNDALAAISKQAAARQQATPAPLQLAPPVQVMPPPPIENQAILRARQLAAAMLSRGKVNPGIET